jgi:hypothetical protein
MKFMMQKILLDKEYVPNNKFDWSYSSKEVFKKNNANSRHSSISSCDIECEDEPCIENPKKNGLIRNLTKI